MYVFVVINPVLARNPTPSSKDLAEIRDANNILFNRKLSKRDTIVKKIMLAG